MTTNKTCENYLGYNEETDSSILCGKTATVEKWDCCEGTQFYCSECVWDGGQTSYCEWANYDLDGNLLAQG